MLSVLHIENIAVIEQANISFDRGFNVLTGETGAGKSIVIDAISAILGERTYRDVIRTGAGRAFVSAVFTGTPRLAWFEENQIPYDPDELLVQREVYTDGKNVCRVNGRPVTVSILKRLGEQLIQIHGQHDSQQLFDEATHLQYLDLFSRDGSLLGQYSEKYARVQALRQEIDRLSMGESEKLRLVEALKFQIDEIERAALHPGEDEELEARRKVLQNAEKITGALQSAMAALYGDESSSGAAELLAGAEQALSRVERVDESIGALHGKISDLMYAAQDAAEELRDTLDGLSYSAEELEAIERASQVIPVFKTANMSLGINVMLDLVQKAAKALPEFDIEIVEKHHNAKVDAPSGTALLIADAMKEACLADKTYVFGRHTKTQRRQREEIGIHAVRGGTVTGEHEVYFFGNDETIEIKHAAASRRIFALGALQAAAFLQGKKPGLYDMRDVLLEKSGVTNLYADDGQTLLTLRGLGFGRETARVFSSLAASEVNVDMISQAAPAGGKVDLSFTIARADLPRAKEVLGALGLAPEEDGQVCKIVIEGVGMEHQPGVAAGVFEALEGAGISPRLISTSETKIGVAVSCADADRAAQVLREKYAL